MCGVVFYKGIYDGAVSSSLKLDTYEKREKY